MYTLPQWRDYFWVDISAQMRRLQRPQVPFADGFRLERNGQFGEWLWKVLTTAYEKLTDGERMTATVRAEQEEGGLFKLCWLVKETHAEAEEREWVLVNVGDVEVD